MCKVEFWRWFLGNNIPVSLCMVHETECLPQSMNIPNYNDMSALFRKVDERQHGKGNSRSHGATPFHQIVSMIK
jgi:hypothetical protein